MRKLATRCAFAVMAIVVLAMPAWGEMSAEELAKATQNPVADLISIPIQNNINFGVGPKDNIQNVTNIQPVIPIDAGDRFNVITRTILPIVSNPALAPGQHRKTGLGDTTFTAFLSPKEGAFVWGVGPIINIPTAPPSACLGTQSGARPSAGRSSSDASIEA